MIASVEKRIAHRFGTKGARIQPALLGGRHDAQRGEETAELLLGLGTHDGFDECGVVVPLEINRFVGKVAAAVAGRKEFKAAGNIALNDAGAFACARGRNGGGETRGPAADYQDVIGGVCVHLGLGGFVRGNGLDGRDGLGQHTCGQCGFNLALIAGLGECRIDGKLP